MGPGISDMFFGRVSMSWLRTTLAPPLFKVYVRQMAKFGLIVSNLETPNTRAVLLEGLRQALQSRVAQIWMTVTSAGDKDFSPGIRFENGISEAITDYEVAWHYIDKVTKDGSSSSSS